MNFVCSRSNQFCGINYNPKQELARQKHGDLAPSILMLTKWIIGFLFGRTSTSDVDCSQQPNEMNEKIHEIILDNWRLKVREIMKAIDLSLVQSFRFKIITWIRASTP